jgi:hypothetical protein
VASPTVIDRSELVGLCGPPGPAIKRVMSGGSSLLVVDDGFAMMD